jgi:hypothetical protein
MCQEGGITEMCQEGGITEIRPGELMAPRIYDEKFPMGEEDDFEHLT